MNEYPFEFLSPFTLSRQSHMQLTLEFEVVVSLYAIAILAMFRVMAKLYTRESMSWGNVSTIALLSVISMFNVYTARVVIVFAVAYGAALWLARHRFFNDICENCDDNDCTDCADTEYAKSGGEDVVEDAETITTTEVNDTEENTDNASEHSRSGSVVTHEYIEVITIPTTVDDYVVTDLANN